MTDETNTSANNAVDLPEKGASAAPPQPKYTDADVDRIVADKINRERKRFEEKYADYPDLKKAADQWKAHEDAQKTELEKLQAQIADWQNRATQAETARKATLVKSSVMAEAAKQGVPADRLDAAYKLLDTAKLSVDENDTVAGLEDAIKALLEANSFLLVATAQSKPKTPSMSPTNPASDAPISNPVMDQVKARLQGQGQTFGRGGVIWNKGSEG